MKYIWCYLSFCDRKKNTSSTSGTDKIYDMKRITLLENGGHRSRDRIVVGFTTISAISCEFESGSGEVYSIHHCVIKFASDLPPLRLENLKCKVRLCKVPTGASLPWSYRSWIYNYLCNQCLSPLMLSVQISIRARCTTLYDKICQWLATSRWFSPGPPPIKLTATI